MPDDQWGETVLAIVVLAPDATLTLDELDTHCRERLGGYKVPRRLEIVSCPSCGRAQVDVYTLAEEVTAGLEDQLA